MSAERYHYKVKTIKLNPFSKAEKQDQVLADAINRAMLEGYELMTVTHPYGGHPRLFLRR